MKEYKDQFPSDSLELSNDIEARKEYLDKLEKIIKEGLPKHEATLKTMLNKNTIDDIVAFDNKCFKNCFSNQSKTAAYSVTMVTKVF